MSGGGPTTWREAARAATFLPHRPVEPAPQFVWLGGFGFDGASTTTHLAICASVGGGPLDVETATTQRWAPGLEQRQQIAHEVRQYLLRDLTPVSLPLELRVEPEERGIVVDGVDRAFSGFRLAGSARWSGSCQIGEVWVTVTATAPATVTSIGSTDGADLQDSPPAR